MKEQLYIYSIIKNRDIIPPELVGINSQKIIFIPYQEITAVASKITLSNFSGLETEELKRFVSVHEKVNEWLIKDYDVIPLKFGTIIESKEQLFDFLEETYPRFTAALEQVSGKAEFVVETLWEEKKIMEEIVNENPEIQKLKQEIASQGKLLGKILGLKTKLRLGKLVFNSVESRRKQYVKDVLNFLKNYASDFREGKILNKQAIMSYSFLINKSQESEFESKLRELNEKHQNKLRFKYIGPMAPYSFANVVFVSASKESVEEARKILGVGKKASWPEIKIAYRNLASQYHPDKHGGTQKTEKQMERIIKAYKTLEKVHNKSIIVEK